MRRYTFLFAFILLACCAWAQNNIRPEKWATPVHGLKLNNMYNLDEGVYRSEQPEKKAFSALEAFGVTEVLNLRYWHSDQKYATDTKIQIKDVPMNAHNINDYDIILALKTIKNRKGKIVFHCKHGSDRTGVVAAMYRIVIQNWSKEEALDELINGEFGFHSIYTNIPQYIIHSDVDKIRRELNKQ